MRSLAILLLGLALPSVAGDTTTVLLHAPGMPGEKVLLYALEDPFTDRPRLLDESRFDPKGTATLQAGVERRTRCFLRLRTGRALLYLEPGATYRVDMERSTEVGARSIGATHALPIVFTDLDILDVNALVSDLNERLDAFLADHVAGDETAGMTALGQVRGQQDVSRDSTGTRDWGLLPGLSSQAIDSFAGRLDQFYAEIDDPWFHAHRRYAVAGLYLGPRSNDRDLYERFIQETGVRYDDPEYVRFLRGVFQEHLRTHPFRRHGDAFLDLVKRGEVHAIDSLLKENDLLLDHRLRELVMLDQFYLGYHDQLFDKEGIRTILTDRAAHSPFPEHRALAGNMLWDLTHMTEGGTFPSLELTDLQRQVYDLDLSDTGMTCLAVIASWCTYCEVEIGAFESLAADHAGVSRFVVIGLDSSLTEWGRFASRRDREHVEWAWAPGALALMDQLRLRAVPGFFMVEGERLGNVPGPLPSEGLAAVLHRRRVELQQRGRIRFGSEAPPPPRR